VFRSQDVRREYDPVPQAEDKTRKDRKKKGIKSEERREKKEERRGNRRRRREIVEGRGKDKITRKKMTREDKGESTTGMLASCV
jgi:hypothetical protein